jgi:hypothetical protein
MDPKEISSHEWHRIEDIAYDKLDENLVDKCGFHSSPPVPVDPIQGKIVEFGPSRYLVTYTGVGTTQLFWVNDKSEAEPVYRAPDLPIPETGQIVRIRRDFKGEKTTIKIGHLFTIKEVKFGDFIMVEEVSDIIIKRCDQRIVPFTIVIHGESDIPDRRALVHRFWEDYEITSYSPETAKDFMRDFRAISYPEN